MQGLTPAGAAAARRVLRFSLQAALHPRVRQALEAGAQLWPHLPVLGTLPVLPATHLLLLTAVPG
jgi:hypothetical protein